MIKKKNIKTAIPKKLPLEFFEDILKTKNFRFERIISKGHSSPKDFWYDQKENEWVYLVSGKAKLKFKDKDKPIELFPGDYIEIPAGVKHRVEWTDPTRKTIWLALYY